VYSATSTPAQRLKQQQRRNAAAKRDSQEAPSGGGGGYGAFAVSTVKGYKLYVASLLGLD